VTTDHEMAMRVHVALGGHPDGMARLYTHEVNRLVAIGRELDKASRRDVAAEVVAAGEVSR
jgi:hypothetical protein